MNDIRDDSMLYHDLGNGKKNILFVVHDNWKGGTQLHVQNLTAGLSSSYNCFILLRNGQSLLLTLYNKDNNVDFMFELNDEYNYMVYTTPEFKKIIKNILIGMRISLVHVHNIFGHTMDIFYEAFRLNIPLVMTLHDFYYLCPTVHLLDVNLDYCKGIHDNEKCLTCSTVKLGYNYDIINEWRTEIRKILARAAQIFTPSHVTKEIYCEYYDEIRSKTLVFEHGAICRKSNYHPKLDRPLNIAFVGQISPHKGSYLIYDLVMKNTDKSIKWHLFGGIGDTKIGQLNRSDVLIHGAYNSDEIVELLQKNNIQIVCILSIWPETYSYTLTESLLAGIPVLVTDIGALGERVRAQEVGWLVEYNAKAEKILAVLKEIKDNSDNYKKVVEQVSNCKLKTAGNMCIEYYNVYESLLQPSVERDGEYFDSQIFSLAKKNADYYRITQSASINEIIDGLAACEGFLTDEIGIYIFGTGQGGRVLLEHIKENNGYFKNIKGFFDNNSSIWGTEFMDFLVTAPSADLLQKWDIILIASHTYVYAISQKLLSIGVSRDKIICPGILLRNLLMNP